MSVPHRRKLRRKQALLFRDPSALLRAAPFAIMPRTPGPDEVRCPCCDGLMRCWIVAERQWWECPSCHLGYDAEQGVWEWAV